MQTIEQEGMAMKVCWNCRRELPDEQFERYPTGTRRGVCRHCHYVLHTRRALLKWRMKERAEALMRSP